MQVKDVTTGVTVTGVSVFYLIKAQSIRIFQGSGATAINSKTIPSIWGCLLLFLGLVLILRGLLVKTVDEDKKKVASFVGLIKRNQEVLLTGVLLCLYVISLKSLGFILSSCIYLFLQVVLLAKGKRKKALLGAGIISVVASIGAYLLFVYLLDVRLPAGILAF